MGLQDRDYMHEPHRRDSPFTPPPSTAPSGLYIFLILAFSAFALFKGYEWLLERQAKPQPIRQVSPVPLVVRPPVVTDTPSAATPIRQWVKCIVNGQTLYSDTDCAGGTLVARSAVPEVPWQPAHTSTGVTTLFHCKAYNGGTFWARSHCNQHKALVDRMVNVPGSLPFDQQVKMAEGIRLAAASTEPGQRSVSNRAAAPSNKNACMELENRIADLDSAARQPQTAESQDQLREQRKQARDRQFALRC
jgi:hypothetical protein